MAPDFENSVSIWAKKGGKKGKNPDFLKFKISFFGRIGRIVAKNFSDGPTYSQVAPKKFLDQKNKNWKFFSKKFTPPQIDLDLGGGKGYLCSYKSRIF